MSIVFVTLSDTTNGAAVLDAAATLLSQFLFGISSRSPMPYGLSTAVVLLAALMAAALRFVKFSQRLLAALLKIE